MRWIPLFFFFLVGYLSNYSEVIVFFIFVFFFFFIRGQTRKFLLHILLHIPHSFASLTRAHTNSHTHTHTHFFFSSSFSPFFVVSFLSSHFVFISFVSRTDPIPSRFWALLCFHFFFNLIFFRVCISVFFCVCVSPTSDDDPRLGDPSSMPVFLLCSMTFHFVIYFMCLGV